VGLRCPDTQKDLHVVLQVAGAPELTLSPLLPYVQLPSLPCCRTLLQTRHSLHTFGAAYAAYGVSALLGFSDVPFADLLSTSPWVSLFLSAHAACYAHGLGYSRAYASQQASGGQATRAPTLQQWSRRPQHLSGHPAANFGITPSNEVWHLHLGIRSTQARAAGSTHALATILERRLSAAAGTARTWAGEGSWAAALFFMPAGDCRHRLLEAAHCCHHRPVLPDGTNLRSMDSLLLLQRFACVSACSL
jgi:hypothetical protein